MITTKRHAETIKDELWFKSKPWLIAGTGPSLNNHNQSYLQSQYNILAIYNAADILPPDLYMCMDEYAWDFATTSEYKYAITRFECKRQCPDNTIYIGVHTNPSMDGYDNYPSQTANAHAVQLLHNCGVRQIYTVGIDGGIEITAKGLNPVYVGLCKGVNFDDENKIMFDKANKLGVELIKL